MGIFLRNVFICFKSMLRFFLGIFVFVNKLGSLIIWENMKVFNVYEKCLCFVGICDIYYGFFYIIIMRIL